MKGADSSSCYFYTATTFWVTLKNEPVMNKIKNFSKTSKAQSILVFYLSAL